jgi:hypothetical protein
LNKVQQDLQRSSQAFLQQLGVVSRKSDQLLLQQDELGNKVDTLGEDLNHVKGTVTQVRCM